MQYVFRGLKRFVVLIPGILAAYFSVHYLYPFFHSAIPALLAVFFTYVVAAYVLIPAIFRLIRLVLPARHVPLYCVTPDGFASDPVNLAMIGSREKLVEAMQAIGWYEADEKTARTTIRQVLDTVFRREYKNAPVSALFLFGRKQDVSFELPIKGGLGARHHVRFWATTYDPEKPSGQRLHWTSTNKTPTSDGAPLAWLGCASKDVGVSFIRHNAQITHMIDPDTNRERQLIARSLQRKQLARLETVRLVKPYRLPNRVPLGYLQTDGRMIVCQLR
jgi:hypothetical protein